MADQPNPLDLIWGELNMHRILLLQTLGTFAYLTGTPEKFVADIKDRSGAMAEQMRFPNASRESLEGMAAQMRLCHRQVFEALEQALADTAKHASPPPSS